MGGGPTGVPEELDTLKEIAEFPASLEAWVVSYERRSKMSLISFLFPSPIEVSVSSYLTIGINGVNADEFPAPLEG